MKNFYSINIYENFTNILQIEKKKNILNVIEDYSVESKEIATFLKKKKNIHVVVDVEGAIDDIISVPSVIKKDAVLKSYIINKFKETLTTKHLLLNYRQISEDTKEEKTTYKVDAVSYKDFVEKLDVIEDWLEIKSATINKFALLNLSRECFKNSKGEGYISIHSHQNSVNILAIDEDNNLIFERTSSVSMNPDDLLNNTIVDEINQTIAYITQQFRHVKFATLLMSGSLVFDDVLSEHLLLSLNMPIAVLYPNTFVKGLVNEEPQSYITVLGGCFVDKKEQFLPQKILSLRTYNKFIVGLSSFAILSLFLTTSVTFDDYTNYSDSLDRYDSIKAKLLRTVKNTDTYSLDELEMSWKHLQNAEKFLNYRPHDALIKFKPLIDLVVPRNYAFKSKDSKSQSYSLEFTKKFQTLGELHSFEKMFLEKFNEINKKKKLKYTDKTNYSNMTFSVIIAKPEEAKPKGFQRRRRR